MGERLGRLPSCFQQTRRESIWLHAASVGEVQSMETLLGRLRTSFPGVPVYLSTVTPEGREVAEEKLSPLLDGVFYLPLDFRSTVDRALETIRPRVVIVFETEIWPNLFRRAKRSGAGLMMVNGRMSDRSAPRYARFAWFFSKVLGEADRILVQSAPEKEKFLAAGAPENAVLVGGNLKYDFPAGESPLPGDIACFLDRLSPAPLLVAGSTREGEERPIVEAFREISRERPRALLVVAPRHPSRFSEAAETIEACGLPLARRSELDRAEIRNAARPSVFLLDSVGELAALYSRADLVFVGGSLNGWGGHNVLEPALHGCPVVVGPSMQNFRAVTGEMLRERAIVQVEGGEELSGAFEEVLSDSRRANELGERARQAARNRRGASDRAVAEAERLYRSCPAPVRAAGARAALRLPAALWKIGARLHAGAYERGVLKRRALDTFTLCVGNITVGGTGKTPTVMWLVEKFQAAGLRPAVLTRGYRRRDAEKETIVAPNETVAPFVGGDEAQLLLRRCRRLGLSIAVGIGADRYRVGRRIEKAYKPDLLILDDGFQHFGLHRDFDLVLIDVDDPFGGGEMLPLGRLREPPAGLARASAFLLTRARTRCGYGAIEDRLRQGNPSAPIYRSSVETVFLREVAGEKELPLRRLAGRRVLAFAGLGNPAGFFHALKESGAVLAPCLRFPDHHRYSAADVEAVLEAARRHKAQLIATTEKDLVNLRHVAGWRQERPETAAARLFTAIPLAWAGIEMSIDKGEALVRGIVEKVRRKQFSRA